MDVRIGFINLDRIAYPGVDVVHNIEDLPLPFPDNYIDGILARDFFEHVPHFVIGVEGNFMFPFIDELIRISRPNALWEVISPARPESLAAPGHTRLVGIGTFNPWLVRDEMQSLEVYSTQGNLKLLHKINIRKWDIKDILRFGRAIYYRIHLRVIKTDGGGTSGCQ